MMRPRFSERIGAAKAEIQVASVNDALKNSIWNVVSMSIAGDQHESDVVDQIAVDVLRVRLERIGRPARHWLMTFCQKHFGWAEWYDLLEYAVAHAREFSLGQCSREDVEARANSILQREHSGYRFVAGELTQITTPTEIAEIERAVDSAAAVGLDGARDHITHALNLFGNRPEPDYRNAIKEAISAVESIVRVINGKRGGDLRDALDAVSTQIELHPALEMGLAKLYAYTSNKDGVRHSIYGDDVVAVDETDARFMIVSCSAFVNFLISKGEVAGLLKSR